KGSLASEKAVPAGGAVAPSPTIPGGTMLPDPTQPAKRSDPASNPAHTAGLLQAFVKAQEKRAISVPPWKQPEPDCPIMARKSKHCFQAPAASYRQAFMRH